MDYQETIERVYNHLENDCVDKAVMACLRIARHLQDFLYAAVFLREMHPNPRECARILYDDIKHLKKESRTFVSERSLEYWLDTHSLDFALGINDDGEEVTILGVGVSEIDPELEQWEQSIADLIVPSGMGEYDTAAFTDKYTNEKAQIRLRMKALQAVKQRVKTRCLNYAIRIERELRAQNKTQSFLATIQTEVNNYFRAHSEEVYTKLQKAAQLVDSNDPEDFSLLLAQVRRAINASADFFYPPTEGVIKCADGKDRQLGEEHYLNRLNEFLATRFDSSSSRDLLRSEWEYLSVFTRRLNNVASKGVHSRVTAEEAKQGLLGLYMFLYNVTLRLQREDSL